MPYKDLDKERASQRASSRRYYAANKDRILEKQRQQRREPVAGAARRKRERERLASLTADERARRAQLNRDWYQRNPRPPEKSQEQHWRHRYGLSPEQWAAKFAERDGCCHGCGELLDLSNMRSIHVDHDHSCCRGKTSCGDCVRGLLCAGCNHGIGHFGDDPERMRRVADYLVTARAELDRRIAGKPIQDELPINVVRLDGRKKESA